MKKTVLMLVLALTFAATACAKSPNGATSGSAANNPITNSALDTTGANDFPLTRPATGKNVFIFNPKIPAWAAYDPQGNRIRTGRASGGRNFCPDIKEPCRTPVGTFTVFREEGDACQSNTFPIGKGGAPMPNCMFFKGGYAVHGSNEIPGYNASHGCVRVTPAAAEWLNDNVINPGTTVIVMPY